jgi:hypothetical protein
MADQSTSATGASSSSAPAPSGNGGSNVSSETISLLTIGMLSLLSQNQGQDQAQYMVGPPQDPRGGLYSPNISGGNLADDSIAGIVHRLMSPPEYLYSEDYRDVTLTITWAVGVAGQERFNSLQGRHALSLDDDLCGGEAYGLSEEILNWLKGGEDTLTLPSTHFI